VTRASREQAAAISADVYGEESEAYWGALLTGVTEVDKTGVAPASSRTARE